MTSLVGWRWSGVGMMLLLSVVALATTLKSEFGTWRNDAFDGDELYFANCAIRGLSSGDVPSSGCHDNKAPFIFWVHQVIQTVSSPSSVLSIKVAAIVVVSGVLVLLTCLGHLAGSVLGAVAALSFAIQFLAANGAFLALKTETVGAALVFSGLMLLMRRGPWPRRNVYAAGVFIGLAALTKQTHLVLVPTVVAWMFVLNRGGRLADVRTVCALLCAGVVTPVMLTIACFALKGRLETFASSLLLYPSVYGNEAAHSLAYRLVWRVGLLFQELASTPALSVLFVLSFWIPASGSTHTGDGGWRRHCLQLLQWTAVVLIFSVLIAPVIFPYHLVPVRFLMSVVGGVVVADLAHRLSASSQKDLASFNCALSFAALMMTAVALHGHGGRGSNQPHDAKNYKLDGPGHQFGYVLGMWPQFYFANGLTPASNVMFPWAIRGTPGNPYYTLPPAGSWRAMALDIARARGVRELLDDFRRTPPAFIALISDMARSPASPHLTDVPEVAAYLDENCTLLKRHDLQSWRFAQIFDCTLPRSPGVIAP